MSLEGVLAGPSLIATFLDSLHSGTSSHDPSARKTSFGAPNAESISQWTCAIFRRLFLGSLGLVSSLKDRNKPSLGVSQLPV